MDRLLQSQAVAYALPSFDFACLGKDMWILRMGGISFAINGEVKQEPFLDESTFLWYDYSE